MHRELRLVQALTDEQITAIRDPRPVGTVKLPTIEDAVKAGGFLPPTFGSLATPEKLRASCPRTNARMAASGVDISFALRWLLSLIELFGGDA